MRKPVKDRKAGEPIVLQSDVVPHTAIDDDAGGAAHLDPSGAHIAEQVVAIHASELRYHHVARLCFLRGADVVSTIPIPPLQRGRWRLGADQAGKEEIAS